jgi:hypothetical protein
MGYQPPQTTGYTDIKHDLEGFANSADALTHAALCAYKGNLSESLENVADLVDENILLVAHTATNKILLYSLKINWGQASAGQTSSGVPAIESQHLTIIDSCHPTTDSHWTMPPPSLAKLDIIPRSYMDKNATSNPTIMATFVESDGTHNHTPIRTVLSRWELKEEKPTIDSSFLSASAKRAGGNELKVRTEQCTEDIVLRTYRQN